MYSTVVRSKSMAMMQVFSIGGAIVFEAGYRLRCPEVLVAGRFVIGIHTGYVIRHVTCYVTQTSSDVTSYTLLTIRVHRVPFLGCK